MASVCASWGAARRRAVAVGGALLLAGAVIAPIGGAHAASGAVSQLVTLGDSYSSGSGLHRDAEDFDDHGPRAHSFNRSTRLGSGACHRELDDTPGPRLAADIGATSVFVACAGAVIAEIPNQVTAARIAGDGRAAVVTMTIGGNDIRTERGENWPDALVRCITSSRCHRSSKNQVANFDAIEADLTAMYIAIGDEYPKVTVRALGYPRMMQSDRFCEGVTGISRDEADWIDEQVDELNVRIAAATTAARRATGADIAYVSVVDEFDNHGACRFWGRDRFVNDAVFGQTLSRSRTESGEVRDHFDDGLLTFSGASFHPNRKGYDAYFRALRASLPALTAHVSR